MKSYNINEHMNKYSYNGGNMNKLNNEVFYKLSDFFKIFGDATRLKVLNLLVDKEMCVNDIANTLEMTQSNVSHQLKILRQSNLVKIRKDGKLVYYSLSDNHIELILKFGIEHILEVI